MSPSYYAEGNHRPVFEVAGHGLLSIPWDAVGVISNDNNDPLIFKDRLDSFIYTVLTGRSNERLDFIQPENHYYTSFYLGAIVSADRQTVYWVNRSRPLPA